ncbi:lipoprotein [Rhodospirillum rubrum]|uniref:Lipoprotein, putative n=1 Tax=Rhodospirillum rubrum (strain ATCC 11170 / ATH 1.1.1 / DSM 467 / LMG 4362 / NCIMB 8255 / S1) TaxID=269796 RepID=Q2RUF2_RHORT|nr:lipoprotein [Rhodospirillum rubrum]ABC22243.1 lipoprotein, putative [Rhodospirillum rubrum ATCC 11170]AEO47959.1 putative lipoprotein [Rhodospirillum rubrum F11]MBK5953809.1 lipoprotein [Rhodospirillum rubrum]QXG81887.1 lipoprotein [Rhodospirillum rubrum]HAP99371.1 lipoprotein [Rhodospirillum rubrum]
MSHRSPLHRLHPLAGGLGLVTIVVFQLATVLVEAFGLPADIAAVKVAILWSLPVLILFLAGAGASGARLSQANQDMSALKAARMKVVAGNGLLILVPAAFFLAWKAEAQAFDFWFYAVQAVELGAGAVNLVLLARNMRDGLARTGRRQREAMTPPEALS